MDRESDGSVIVATQFECTMEDIKFPGRLFLVADGCSSMC